MLLRGICRISDLEANLYGIGAVTGYSQENWREKYPDALYRELFRFSKQDFPILIKSLGLPDVVKLGNGYKSNRYAKSIWNVQSGFLNFPLINICCMTCAILTNNLRENLSVINL